MIVMKFGGTSMGDAQRQQTVAALVAERVPHDRIALVVSAVGGVTNYLLEALNSALNGDATQTALRKLAAQHEALVEQHSTQLAAAELAQLLQTLNLQLRELSDDLEGVRLLRVCPDRTHARILARGEWLSSAIMLALLRSTGLDTEFIDPRSVIFTSGSLLEGQANFDKIDQAFAPLRQGGARVLLIPGFIACDELGEQSLLGRNGSDLSGALVAMGLHAKLCEIWTDVDGVYSADPRSVPDAQLVREMSYAEAMELSYFGAKVLHPKTIAPIARYAIPTRIRNTFNPQAEGTLIHANANDHEHPVRGISCLDNVALINVAGPGMKGVAGMAARLFAALARQHISIILITQSSSEYSISFCVHEKEAALAQTTLTEEFHLELQAQWLEVPELRRAQSVLSIVGDGMHERRGVAGQFFNALAHADVNVVAIAQGSSERSISAVIDRKESLRALRAAHQQFFNSAQIIDLFIIGVGVVGSQLLAQIDAQQAELSRQGIALRIHGLANSRTMVLSVEAIASTQWREALAQGQPTDMDVLLDFVREQRFINPVLVDCTADESLAARYLDAFAAGLHVATPNKRANTQSQAYYSRLRQIANRQHRRFLYETNVGAGLPVIDTLQNMIKSGDSLITFSGVLSGSMSYVFGLLESGINFSEAVRMAKEKQFTEPDPRDDLSGMDVARKLLILFREAGGQAELSDIEIAPIFPAGFDATGTVSDFMQRLAQVDVYFTEWMRDLRPAKKVLRFAAEIRDGHCRVGIIEVDESHPLFAVKGGENALAFTTRRYAPVPLVIRGYGAGSDVTAAGVFADILRTVSFNPSIVTNKMSLS